MNNLGAILFQYDLIPENYEKYGKVLKVTTNQGTFALKDTRLSRERMDWMLYLENYFKELQFNGFVPIVKTKYGDTFVVVEDRAMYLSPWIEEGSVSPPLKEGQMIQSLAELHGYSVKDHAFSEESIKQFYDRMVVLRESRQFEMEKYVNEIEKRIYLSPFELTFATHFHQLMKNCDLSKSRLDYWFEQTNESKRYRTVFCHGKCSASHFIAGGERGYFINFERSSMDSPVRDLTYLIRASVSPFQYNPEILVSNMSRYESQFALYEEEKDLLASYLYFPESLFNSVTHFTSNQRNWSHMKHVRHFTKKIEVMNGITTTLQHMRA
ncbi:phosphotransferase [Alkalihalobacillus sp. R86527]|uniref:phosphotransferase n=1 Tax=Alkalihalobacillus sp. R86527 TaxID=3093863 RepID=UPI003672BD75